MSFSEFVSQGGPVIIVILAGSVIALAIFLERMYYLRSSLHIPKETLNQIQTLNSQSINQAVSYLRATPLPLHHVLLKTIELRKLPAAELNEHLSPHLAQVQTQLSKGEDILSTIASLSPLLGLLGTVLGMWDVFQAMHKTGLANTGQLAGGIAEALLTTIAGLMVAIPTFIGFKIVGARATAILSKIETQINLVLEKLNT